MNLTFLYILLLGITFIVVFFDDSIRSFSVLELLYNLLLFFVIILYILKVVKLQRERFVCKQINAYNNA
jgi:hypothetical protein